MVGYTCYMFRMILKLGVNGGSSTMVVVLLLLTIVYQKCASLESSMLSMLIKV